jgi:deazaflavin-dependent oxidoreductase (nitroreductase family)
MSTQQFLFGQEHVRRYQETDGDEGFVWKEGSRILLLTTTGRKTGKQTTTPLIFGLEGDTPVIVASQGGAPDHPGWYKNLVKNPAAEVQIKGEKFAVRARDAEGDERERLWELMNGEWRHYDEYQTRTDRRIPVVVLDRV